MVFNNNNKNNEVIFSEGIVLDTSGTYVSNSGGSDSDQDSNAGLGGAIDVENEKKIQIPRKYKVMLMNDDYTPMDFVVLVLRRFFGKDEGQANQIMLDVHKKGLGIAGVYTLEVAEMKVMQVNQFARLNQHPLKSILEEE